jgi:glycosyltransferase involved in cell wall biosynthesis
MEGARAGSGARRRHLPRPGLKREFNPRYYDLMLELEKLTGNGVVLNTSLNRRGEPMICSPTDALNMFFGSDLEYLIMEDHALQSQQVSRDDARAHLGLPQDAWVVGNVGRLHPDKDQATLIRAFAKALPRLPTPSLLAIMGSGTLEQPLKALVKQLGIETQVHWLGQIPEGRRYFKAFDVFALTSDHEPFGMVLLEAMAASVPIICTDCGGGREVAQGVGRLTPLGDSEILATTLEEQARKSADEAPFVREHMQQVLEQRFSDKAIREKFWSLPVVSDAIGGGRMSSKDKRSWHAKAKALDRYRWMQLRERHNIVGSVLRFTRDTVTGVLFGLLARLRQTSSFETEPSDVLLLQSTPKVISLRRKKLLIEALIQRGYRLTESSLDEPGEICRKRLLLRPPQPVPLRYYLYAAHAMWLIEHHRPKILLNDRNGSLYSPFLRLRLKETQALLLHLAHATTVESSRRLGMNDYDYYLLFGQSSLEALKARTLRFGTSIALLTGSHMINQSYDIPPSNPDCRTVLILGVGPDKEREEGYQRTYELIRDWVQDLPQYSILIKRHPRSSVPFWTDAERELQNVAVLPADCSLAHALSQASVVVNIMSNAVIEAGLSGRPVIYCNLSNDPEIFGQQRFFGAAITDRQELHSRLADIEQNYSDRMKIAKSFANFHLAHGSRGLDKTLQVIDSLFANTSLPGDVDRHELRGTIDEDTGSFARD